MFWQIIVTFNCVFLQQVTAEFYKTSATTIWQSFEWKISVFRGQQDEVTIKGFFDEVLAQGEIKIPGANCSDVKKWATETKAIGIPGFVMRCKCELTSSTFVPNLKICAANSEVKSGCQFTTGSWQWSNSWTWDREDDALIVVDNDRDYGISTGFNVTTEYHTCSVVSVSYWVEKMNWTEASDYILNGSKPAMFQLHNMWHFSWNVEEIDAEVKENLKGTILKFVIKCEKPGPPENEDEELEITSCLIVKVAGESNFTSENWELRENVNVTTEANTAPSKNQEKLLISLLVPLGFVLVILGVLAGICYTRRTACFAERQGVRHDTVLDDDIVQSKLIMTPAEESIV